MYSCNIHVLTLIYIVILIFVIFNILSWLRRLLLKSKKKGLLSPKLDPLPVDFLKQLDISKTLERHPRPNAPLNKSKFYREIRWYPKRYYANTNQYKDKVFALFIEPELKNLIPDYTKWCLTPNTIEAITKTFCDKLDRPLKESHGHHKLMWEAYKGISLHLRCKDFKMRKLSYAEVKASQQSSSSSMGIAEQELGYENVGDYINDGDTWIKNVKEFERHLMADKPIKADFYCSVKREAKKVDKTRVVWSWCATARLYEALVFGRVDEILHNLPYTVTGSRAHNNGTIFYKLMQDGDRVAVCDDISGWDSRVSYSMLCMEAAFLQSLAQDSHHEDEIKQLYRLYAHAVVNIPRKVQGQEQNVIYRIRGQVISGRRVTYAMNTLTNMVVNLCRAAISQGVSADQMFSWTMERLEFGDRKKSDSKFGGRISGDDVVIIMGPEEAEKFASSVDFMNDLGLLRKDTGAGKSKLIKTIDGINFCSRNFVKVPMYLPDGREAISRHVPVKKVDEILMRKLLREEDHDMDQSLVWAKQQARDLLVEFFHLRTIRTLALAILAARPDDVELERTDKPWSKKLGRRYNEADIVKLLNDRLFGPDSVMKSDYRAQKLADFGFISKKDEKLYELELSSPQYRKWLSKIPDEIDNLAPSAWFKDPNMITSVLIIIIIIYNSFKDYFDLNSMFKLIVNN